ncbi:MAG: hypothetical protein AB1476_04805 [Candidatus Hadarchaeota archaeon]
MSKTRDARAISNLLGNSAAHYALYGGEQREIGVYTEQAEDLARERSWNQRDREAIKDWAMRRARSEIRQRVPLLGIDEREEEHYLGKAEEFIDNFMGSKLG